MVTEEEQFLTTGDAGRIAEVVPATIVAAADSGRLYVAGRTRNGNRLFRIRDVKAFTEGRKTAQLQRSTRHEGVESAT